MGTEARNSVGALLIMISMGFVLLLLNSWLMRNTWFGGGLGVLDVYLAWVLSETNRRENNVFRVLNPY